MRACAVTTTANEMAEPRTSASDPVSGSLRERITVFLDDLQNFDEQTLLENYVDPTFMSSTYFTEQEIERLRAISIRGRSGLEREAGRSCSKESRDGRENMLVT